MPEGKTAKHPTFVQLLGHGGDLIALDREGGVWKYAPSKASAGGNG